MKRVLEAAEKYKIDIITLDLCSYEFTDKDLDLVIQAFNKIWENLWELKSRWVLLKKSLES